MGLTCVRTYTHTHTKHCVCMCTLVTHVISDLEQRCYLLRNQEATQLIFELNLGIPNHFPLNCTQISFTNIFLLHREYCKIF